MLNRTDILKKLLQLRKSIYTKELKESPTVEDKKIKNDLDNLIFDVIGDFFSEEDKQHIKRILLKAVCDEISLDMAIVAIKEIIATYYNNKTGKSKGNPKEKYTGNISTEEQLAAAYYQKGYR
ncbi:MAG: hypothetical protein ACOCQW_00940 [Halanaerobiaceae bacterium]